MMEIRTEIRGLPELQAMMAVAPGRLGAQVRSWVARESKSFVADFKRELRQKPRKFRSGNWSNRIGGQFKYYVDPGSSGINTTSHIGVNFSGSTGFKESVAKMEEGYRQNSSNALVLPLSRGFEQAGLSMANYKTGRKIGTFKSMLNKANREGYKLFPIRLPQGLFFAINGNFAARSVLLFKAARSINVPKQFSFIQSWTTRIPAIEQRGEIELDKAIKKVLD